MLESDLLWGPSLPESNESPSPWSELEESAELPSPWSELDSEEFSPLSEVSLPPSSDVLSESSFEELSFEPLEEPGFSSEFTSGEVEG